MLHPPRGMALAALVLAVLLSSQAASTQQQPEPEVHGVFDGDSMYTVLPPNAIPAILQASFVTGESAAGQMNADEPIIGLTIGAVSRAYSLWQLDSHEIVNDQIDDVVFAVVW